MKYTIHTCPNCKAPLPIIEENQTLVKCEYCGSAINLMLTDTEIKKQETELKEKMFIAEQEEKEQQKEQQRQRMADQKKRKNLMLTSTIAWLIATIAFFMMWFLSEESFFALAFFITLVLFIRSYRKERRELQKPGQIYESRTKSIPVYDDNSSKDRFLAFLICLFFGVIGVHHFYVGRVGKGILYIFTGGLFGIGVLVDLILIASGKFKDRDGRYLR